MSAILSSRNLFHWIFAPAHGRAWLICAVTAILLGGCGSSINILPNCILCGLRPQRRGGTGRFLRARDRSLEGQGMEKIAGLTSSATFFVSSHEFEG